MITETIDEDLLVEAIGNLEPEDVLTLKACINATDIKTACPECIY